MAQIKQQQPNRLHRGYSQASKQLWLPMMDHCYDAVGLQPHRMWLQCVDRGKGTGEENKAMSAAMTTTKHHAPKLAHPTMLSLWA
eukprot:1811373-Amphidinium_carterae.1